jgi:hypothetical protein
MSFPASHAQQAFAFQAELGPVIEGHCANAAVKRDGGLVPVQHGPVEAPAATFHGEQSQVGQQGFANAMAAETWVNEKVLKVNSGLSQKGRVVGKVQGKTRRLTHPFGDYDLCAGAIAKQRLIQLRFRGHDAVGQFLIFGQGLDEPQDEGAVIPTGRPDVQIFTCRRWGRHWAGSIHLGCKWCIPQEQDAKVAGQ